MQKEIDRKAPFLSPISVVLRAYRPSACSEVLRLFYDTVHTVNAKDYTEEQLDAWAPEDRDLTAWDQSFQGHFALVAVEGETLLGFGDITPTGYLDRLYVHQDHLRQGIATALCERLEGLVQGPIVTHASYTARPFFAQRGYRLVRAQAVERRGVKLTNFVMRKDR